MWSTGSIIFPIFATVQHSITVPRGVHGLQKRWTRAMSRWRSWRLTVPQVLSKIWGGPSPQGECKYKRNREKLGEDSFSDSFSSPFFFAIDFKVDSISASRKGVKMLSGCKDVQATQSHRQNSFDSNWVVHQQSILFVVIGVIGA